MVCFDPLQKKAPEYHLQTTETFLGVHGIGLIRLGPSGNNVRPLLPGDEIAVSPNTVYQLENTDPHAPFCLLATLQPPFNPQDVYELSA